MMKYKEVECGRCNGRGYDPFFIGPYGPTECYTCEGHGVLYVYKNGALAEYPGGPLAGSLGKSWDEIDGEVKELELS